MWPAMLSIMLKLTSAAQIAWQGVHDDVGLISQLQSCTGHMWPAMLSVLL